MNELASEIQCPVLKINRFQVEENAVFLNYTPDEMQKVCQKYQEQNYHYRYSLSKNLATVMELVTQQNLKYRLLLNFTNDSEQIQAQVIKYFNQLIKKTKKITDYQNHILEPLLVLVNGLHLDVKEQASQLLSQIANWLTQNEKIRIENKAIQLSKNLDEENKIVAIQLMSKLTSNFDQQHAHDIFLNTLMPIYEDSTLRIRKYIIASSIEIAKNVNIIFLDNEIIDNFYLKKCDQNIWGIRKACVQIMIKLVELTQNKKKNLADKMINFTKDDNKIVKIAAFKVIPEFIVRCGPTYISEKIVDLYLKLIDHDINKKITQENQLAQKVAYYFPGILLTVGKQRWPIMKKLFDKLIRVKSYEVKLPIASSFYQISRIIGPELSKEHMFTALDFILKQNSDSLKLNIISHLWQFVQLFDKITRENLIDIFLVLQKDPKKWRVRHSIAQQMKQLSRIYETEVVFKYILPISLKLCNDHVALVRDVAAQQMLFVIKNLQGNKQLQNMAIESIKGYAYSEKYIQRQTFVKMMRHMYQLQDFSSKLMNLLQKIASDEITIVRITLAITIKQIIQEDQNAKKTILKISINIFEKQKYILEIMKRYTQ